MPHLEPTYVRPKAVAGEITAEERLRRSVAASAKFCSTPEELSVAERAWRDYYATSGDMDLEGLFLGDMRRFDAKYVLRTVARCGRIYKYVDPQFKEDRTITLAAVRRWHRALYFAHESLSDDPAFTEEAFAVNFNVLPLIKNPSESMQKEYRRIVGLLKQLGIEYHERFDTRTALEIIRNRTSLHDIDPRLIALFVFTTNDWNHAFSHNSIPDFMEQGFSALYYEAECAADFAGIRRELGGIGGIEGSILFTELGAHSSLLRSSFGGTDPSILDAIDPDRCFDATDITRGIAAELFGMRRFMAPGSALSVVGCGAGGGRGAILNVANTLASTFPQCRVLAPTVQTNVIEYLFDRCRVARAVYFDEGIDYTVEPMMDELPAPLPVYEDANEHGCTTEDVAAACPDEPYVYDTDSIAASADLAAAGMSLGAQLVHP